MSRRRRPTRAARLEARRKAAQLPIPDRRRRMSASAVLEMFCDRAAPRPRPEPLARRLFAAAREIVIHRQWSPAIAIAIALLLAFSAGCTDDATEPTTPTTDVVVSDGSGTRAPRPPADAGVDAPPDAAP